MPNLQVVSGSDANEPNAMQIDGPFLTATPTFLYRPREQFAVA